ncbi:MAG: hypothetical protein JW751_20735 [Polyangiaceae bacterium]|nr:hypothetical protein [Polyangiaceae bacterium]
MSLAEPIAVTLELVAGLDALGLGYVVGGSVASSVHGIPRATQDIDVVVMLFGKDVDGFVARFESNFYVDRDMVMDAVRRCASFNIIHLATMYKVDVFVADRTDLVREELDRRLAVELGEPPRRVWVCSAEDIVLQKLSWYEQGDRISERQWLDVQGVLKVQGAKLDVAYVRRWAETMRLGDLLQKALREAGLG